MNITVRSGLFPLVRGTREGGNPRIRNNIFLKKKCMAKMCAALIFEDVDLS